MDENRTKPFACSVEGCEMTFTNEDHLNWHQKTHDIPLILGLAINKSSEIADQTPTPTRFIRNCEEVGLFQDLQNVNPFEETFKKAMDCVQNGTPLTVPASGDDTLHTPHILPHVTDNNTAAKPNNKIASPSISDDDCDYKLTIDDDTPPAQKKRKSEPSKNFKDKLKEALQKKGKKKVCPSIVIHSADEDKTSADDSSHQETDAGDRDRVAKIREMNRAAQLRCRKRKQVKWKKLEEENRALKSENHKLNVDNQMFRKKIYNLKELLLHHKKHGAHNHQAFITKLEEVLLGNHIHSNLKKSDIAPAVKPKVIVPIRPNNVVIEQTPLIIKLVGPIDGFAQFLPTTSTN